MLAVAQGRSLTEALADVPAAHRPAAQALSFHTLRQWGQVRAVRTTLTKPATAPDLAALLDVAIGLLLPALPDDGLPADPSPAEQPCAADARAGAPRYEAHTVVNQAVDAAKADKALRHAAPMVNAVLRRVVRDTGHQPALAQTATLEAQWNHPAWWVRALQKDWPAQWQPILAANQQHPPMSLRVNAMQGSRDAYAERLAAAGLACEPCGDWGLSLQRAVPVTQLPGFEVGACSVQDAHAQLAAPLLLAGLRPSATPSAGALRVLDACAAPGGKTAHLLEWWGHHANGQAAEVLALDQDAHRLRRVADTLERLSLPAHLKTTLAPTDAGAPADWWDGQAFDAVLLDAPCTASGIVRRHPDVRWLRRPADVAQLAAEQARLLDALWPLVKPGGRLLYCTCSVFKAEGAAQAKAFVSRHTNALTLPAPGHLLPGSINHRSENATRGSKIEGDGFFYALFQKT